MNRAAIWTIIIIVIIVILIAVIWFYSANNSMNYSAGLNNTSNNPAADTVRVGSVPALGNFLVDANGKTLYYFANDVVIQSNCSGQCSAIWPPFYASNIVVSGDLTPSDFNQITTSSGANQTTYKGWPLYYYSGDKNSGDTTGQGFQNIWFVATDPFYNVMIMNNSTVKSYLSDARGMTLYYNNTDKKGTTSSDPKSNCTGDCLTTWTVFDQSQTIAPALLKTSDFKEFTRPDGTTQLSYRGWPLYQYTGDASSGNTKGNSLSKTWYLVKP